MKKYIAVLLSLCCLLALSAFAFASDPDYRSEYEAFYGRAPSADDYESDEDYQAAYDRWFSGFAAYVNLRASAQDPQQAAPAETPSVKSTESAGENSENDSSLSHAPGSAGQHPDRVRVDLAGNIYSLDGELLSSGTTPASYLGEDDLVPSAELVDPADVSSVSDVDTLAVIAGLVSDIAADQPVLTIEDLRPVNPPAEVLTGMKALVTSIFGEYTPVTTTSVVTQTVGNDTHQYLVEAVAPGAAGVDYEWVAGVVLFAIMLYCLMKLLGGILK